MTSVATIQWASAARTETGKVRSCNEDAVLAKPANGIWAIADGMGGHQNGALASRLIIEQLADLPPDGDLNERLQDMRKVLHGLNRILSQDLTLVEGRGEQVIGSTVVALLVDGDRGVCIWAGDSRCYLARGRRLYQLSRDHCLMQELINEQHLSPLEASRHPSARALTRAVGASEQLSLEVVEFRTHPGDTLLLCSDGLYQGISPTTLGAALNLPSPRHALDRLFQLALKGPAKDNISAIVIRR
ncbi:MAG: serine/threonine-protein phosphatase [Pseudomonadaceae bacterium]|nr:MAG: serine/threonine-protein phosphatase [Pseudomonadaceae bacterium]